MAVPSNKYSSSPLTSSRPNSNSRNSEISNPMRRSFSGNPFTKPSIVANPRGFNPNTPANSPSEFTRRNSMGRESVSSLRDHEEKENTKDQNPKLGRVRSPASSKGTKNFMSPTISAASKIAPSPKKKILVERNEPARTSLSFSNEKSQFRSVRFSDVVEDIDAKADIGLQDIKVEASDDKEVPLTASLSSEALSCEEVLDAEVPLSSKIDSKPLLEEPDCVNLDPTFKISPTSSCSWSYPTVAPLDADPSRPPYDPKTNYLSPRPQFLHYRPNPRIELYLNAESDVGQLEEESFISGSFSDLEFTEETQSDDSQKETEDVSSVETVKGEDEQEEVHVCEPGPITSHLPKETIAEKGRAKGRSFARSKLFGLLLVLSLVCLSISVTNSPVVDRSVTKEYGFFKVYRSHEISESAKANIGGLAQNIWPWYANSISFVSEMMPYFRGAHISGPLHFYNLTTLSETRPVDGCRLFDQSHKARSEKFERALGSMREREADIKPQEEEAQPALEADENILEDSERLDGPEYEGESSQETEEDSKEHGTSESEEVLQALEAEVIEPDALEVQQTREEVLASYLGTQQKSDVNDEEQPIMGPKAEKIQSEVSGRSTADAEVIEPDALEVQQTQEEVLASYLGTLQKSDVNDEEQPIMGPKAEKIQSEVSGAAELQGKPATISFSEKECAKVAAKPESSELDASSENVPVSEAAEFQGEPATISFSEKESAKVDEKPESSELDASAENVPVSEVEDESTISSSKERSFRETELRITLLVLTFIAASVFIYVRKGKPTTTSTATKVEQPQLNKKLDFSPISANNENNSQNWQTEVDVVGESCPSEMSSFQKSSSYSSKKGLKGSSEAQSQERKPRKNNKRESLASSSEYSMGSPSYGSFTTYEKIPIKHGHIEEETITPVRRSSRIRNQVTSP